jgi:hypothetical protein
VDRRVFRSAFPLWFSDSDSGIPDATRGQFESAEGFGKCSSKIVVGQIQPNDRRLTVVALSALYAVPAALCSWRSKPPDAMCPLRTPGRLEQRDQRRALGSGDWAVRKPSVETGRIASRIMLIDSAYETTRSRRGLVGTAAYNCLPSRHTFWKPATNAAYLHQRLNRKSEGNSVVRVGRLEESVGFCLDYDCFALARERWSALDVEVHTDPTAKVLGDEVDNLWSEFGVNGVAGRTQQADNKENTYGHPSP